MNRSLLTALFLAPLFLASSTILPSDYKPISYQEELDARLQPIKARKQWSYECRRRSARKRWVKRKKRNLHREHTKWVAHQDRKNFIKHQKRILRQKLKKLPSQLRKQAGCEALKGAAWASAAVPFYSFGYSLKKNSAANDPSSIDVIARVSLAVGVGFVSQASSHLFEAEQLWHKASKEEHAMMAYRKKKQHPNRKPKTKLKQLNV